MATKVKDTPILTGKDAINFNKKIVKMLMHQYLLTSTKGCALFNSIKIIEK